MAWASVLLAILAFQATLEAAPTCPLTPQGIDNFNDLILEFVDCVAQEKNLDVKWWDVEATDPYFDMNERYKKYKINITTANIKYSKKKPLQARLHKKTEVETNKSNKPIRVTMKYKEAITTTSTVDFNKAFEYSKKLGGDIKFPVMNLGLSVGVSKKTEKKLNKVTNTTKTIVVQKSVNVEVPPKSKITCVFETKEKWEESNWTADITLRGYIAVKIENPFNPKAIWRQCIKKKVPKKNRKCHTNYKEGSGNVYFYPITNIVQDNPNYKVVKDALVFKGAGKYKGPVDIATTNICK